MMHIIHSKSSSRLSYKELIRLSNEHEKIICDINQCYFPPYFDFPENVYTLNSSLIEKFKHKVIDIDFQINNLSAIVIINNLDVQTSTESNYMIHAINSLNAAQGFLGMQCYPKIITSSNINIAIKELQKLKIQAAIIFSESLSTSDLNHYASETLIPLAWASTLESINGLAFSPLMSRLKALRQVPLLKSIK